MKLLQRNFSRDQKLVHKQIGRKNHDKIKTTLCVNHHQFNFKRVKNFFIIYHNKQLIKKQIRQEKKDKMGTATLKLSKFFLDVIYDKFFKKTTKLYLILYVVMMAM